MSQVDKKIKETAFECTKPIDADIKRAITKMERVDEKAKELAKESTKDVEIIRIGIIFKKIFIERRFYNGKNWKFRNKQHQNFD